MAELTVTVPANVRFTYLEDFNNPKRVMAIARTFNKETKEVKFSYSICNPRDTFKKKKAHMICMGRLEKDPYVHTIGENDSIIESIFNRLSVEAKEEVAKKIVLDEINYFYDVRESECLYSE